MGVNLPAWLKFDWQALLQLSVWGTLFSTLLQYALLLLLLLFLFRLLRLLGELVRGGSAVKPSAAADFTVVQAALQVVEDEQKLLSQKVFPLAASLTVGRGAHNDVVLADPFVSYEHTCITRYPGGRYVLTDLGSTNRTLVNEQAVQGDVVLQAGDRIRIGSVIFKFER